jgi:hypothetical protein
MFLMSDKFVEFLEILCVLYYIQAVSKVAL